MPVHEPADELRRLPQRVLLDTLLLDVLPTGWLQRFLWSSGTNGRQSGGCSNGKQSLASSTASAASAGCSAGFANQARSYAGRDSGTGRTPTEARGRAGSSNAARDRGAQGC
jgi:hypothetical protein